VDVLLEEGYNVRGTVRAEKAWLNRYFDEKYGKGRFETVVLKSLEDESAFDAVVKGVSAIAHVAADVNFSPDPNNVIPQVITGTVMALKAAAKQPSIKSVVVTSSSTACLLPQPGKEGIVIDENGWNDAAVETAWSKAAPPDQMPFTVYAASKTESERESWKWMKANNPHFVLNTVLPNYNMGKILLPEIGGSTMSYVRKLLEGDDQSVKSFPPQWYVNVRDTARLHVAALLDPQVESERLFGFAAPYNWTDVVDILHKLRPENTKIPKAPENEARDLSDIKPSKRAEQLIQSFFGVPGWTSLEDSIAEGIADME